MLSITTHAGSSPPRTLARFLTQYWAKNQVREGNTHPTAITAILWWSTHYLPSCGRPLSQTHVDDASSPPRTLAGFSHPILGREPDAHSHVEDASSPGLLAQYWAGKQMPTFLWMMPRRREPSPGFLTQYWVEPPRLRELPPGFLTQYWAENLMPTFSCG
jgi:hypothetical protein